MVINVYERGKYQVIKVKKSDYTIVRLYELEDLIKGYIGRGKKFIAVSFTDAAYIYSGAISVLINCYKMVKDAGGDLCIVEPDPGLLNILDDLNIERMINIYVNEDYLPQ